MVCNKNKVDNTQLEWGRILRPCRRIRMGKLVDCSKTGGKTAFSFTLYMDKPVEGHHFLSCLNNMDKTSCGTAFSFMLKYGENRWMDSIFFHARI